MDQEAKDVLRAGTGFMMCLTDGIHQLEKMGYTENLIPNFDHFEIHSGEISVSPREFVVDDIFRFENTSDPDDQAIAYAISSAQKGIKGIYVESYGLYHDDLSAEMNQKLASHID
jgi:hypothetical protein